MPIWEKIYKNQDAPANWHSSTCALQPFLGYSMVDRRTNYIKNCDCGFDPRTKEYWDGMGNCIVQPGPVTEGSWDLQSHKDGEYPPLICYGKDVKPGEYTRLTISLYPVRPSNMKLMLTGNLRLDGNDVYCDYKKKFLVEILEKYDE